jgi:hypothetical protein
MDAPAITREQFIAAYLERSEITDAKVDGEKVYLFGDSLGPSYALRCRCEEQGCEGWAMIPASCRGWHLFRNADDNERPTYEDACAMDAATREQERLCVNYTPL